MNEKGVAAFRFSNLRRPYMSVPETLQMRVTAKNWNDAGRFGPYCELLSFSLTRHELGNGLTTVCSFFGLCDCMRTLDSGVLSLRAAR